MKIVPQEINIVVERPQVAVVAEDYMSERLCFFHKWTEQDHEDFALVENTDGFMEYAPADRIRFLPVGHDIPRGELETIYYEIGILKRSEDNA